jgi:micrococcal nuclease
MRRNNGIAFKSPLRGMGWRSFSVIAAASCAALVVVIFFTGGPQGVKAAAVSPRVASDLEQAQFSQCGGPVRFNCIIDGDTFWYQGRKIRIADINTPETDQAQCDSERQLGEAAKSRLGKLLNAGGFTLAANPDGRDTDTYGRDLRILMRGGQSLGDVLVAEGLAEQWQGYRRDWC